MGAINGVMVHLTKLPSFIVTLGMMFVLWGLNYAVTQRLTGQVTVSGVREYSGFASADVLFGSSSGPFQVSLVWWLLLTVLGAVMLLRTTWGNWIFAIGGNSDAARAVGVPVMKVRVGLFMTTAAAAWLVGTLTVIRYGNATVTSGIGLEFYFIIAAVIGGCMLTGGAGSVIGASIGALIFGMVQQGMPLVGLPERVLPHHPGPGAAGCSAGEPVDQEASPEGDHMSDNPALTAPPSHATTIPVLEARGITKSFGA